MRYLGLALALSAATALSVAPLQAAPNSEPQIDYPGFLDLSLEVAAVRAERLVDLAEFRHRAALPETLILDTRSAAAFAEGHMAGAVNLPFSDFTDAKLLEVIGENPDREILIYCNNNFSNNIRPIMTKRAPLALNIPTFINLYGYGYRNIYELGAIVDLNEPLVQWVGDDLEV
jgi:phage shock protein E